MDIKNIKGFITPEGIVNNIIGETLDYGSFKYLKDVESVSSDFESMGAKGLVAQVKSKFFDKILRWESSIAAIPKREGRTGLHVITGAPNSTKSSIAFTIGNEVTRRLGVPLYRIRFNEPLEDMPVISGTVFPLFTGVLDSLNIMSSFVVKKALGEKGTSKVDENIYRMLGFFCHAAEIIIIGTYNTGSEEDDVGAHNNMIKGAADSTLIIMAKDPAKIGPSSFSFRSRKSNFSFGPGTAIENPSVTKVINTVVESILAPRSSDTLKYTVEGYEAFIKKTKSSRTYF